MQFLDIWLYKKNHKDVQFQWKINVKDNTYWTEHGITGKKIVTDAPTIVPGKNIGKKNETSPEAQALLKAESIFTKKMKEGYVLLGNLGKVRATLLFKPMLAKGFKDYQNKVKYPLGAQCKLNGVRCAAYLEDNQIKMMSRKGESFNCVDHIRDQLAPIFKDNPDLFLDGELFNPIYKNNLGALTRLVSVRRTKPEEEDIQKSKEIVQYHIYDIFSETNTGVTKKPYKSRFLFLEAVFNQYKLRDTGCIFLLSYEVVNNIHEVNEALEKWASQGDEGVILRNLEATYQCTKTKDLLKLKKFEDDEFEIVGLTEGVGNWAGAAKTAICKLKTPNKKTKSDTFESNLEGERPSLVDLWNNRESYIGQFATVRYQELSPYGVPLIPYTGLPFRNYENKE